MTLKMSDITLDRLKSRKNTSQRPFKHCLLPEYKGVYNVDKPSGRIYVTPDGEFPSVTTFLSSLDTDTEWLDKWADKLGGKDKAEAEMNRCADRGTGVHLSLEHLLNNDPRPELAGDYKSMYYQLEKVLRISVDHIYGLEIPLWSKILGLAGRCDCVAKYNGQLSIIDYKTSNKMKRADWIINYFLQATCYSVMLEHLYGLKAEKLVIMVSVENDVKPQIFTRDRRDYMLLLSEKIKEFRLLQSKKIKQVDMFDMFN